MKTSFNSKFRLLLFILITVNSHSFAQQRIAYVDADSIIQNMSEYVDGEATLNDYSFILKRRLEDKQTKFQQDYENAVDTIQRFCSITPEHQKRMEQRIAKKQKELEQLTEQVNDEIIQKEDELFRPINEKFDNALAEVAKENNLTYIFDKKDILYINYGIDANNLVQKKLDSDILIKSRFENPNEQKIAYVEADSILNQLCEYYYLEVRFKLDSLILSKRLKVKQGEFQLCYENVLDTMRRGTPTPEQQRKMEKRVQQKQKELEQLTTQVNAEIAKKKEALYKPITEKFNQALDEVARENHFIYIFDKKEILYINDGIDTSDLVKAKLNIN